MHNHFRCSCSLCAFSLRKRFLHISRSALQSSIHYSKNKQTNTIRCFWKLYPSSIQTAQCHIKWKWLTTHKRRFWWQPPPPEVLTSETINVRTAAVRFPSLLFLQWARILCFQWPVLCSTAKTSHGRLHRKSITSPLFHCFTALGRLL